MTAYVKPPRWKYGYKMPAATMNLYSQGQTAVHERAGDVCVRPVAAIIEEKGPHAADREGSVIMFRHKYRFLVFRSSGLLHDPAEIEDDIGLSDEDTWTTYDLDSVSWLMYGGLYYVSGVDYAWESDVAT